MNIDEKTVFVTGGAGFIGSAVIRQLIAETDTTVVNIDKLTYAGNLATLGDFQEHPRHIFIKLDICDAVDVKALFNRYTPRAIMHLAAESHVDRSIDGPAAFIESNIIGTYTLLEAAREYWSSLSKSDQLIFRFHHISTDEVFGSLGESGFFTEQSQYQPNSPYSASKASSDHLVRAWHHTYNLPTLMTNCSNNYGPYQFSEKLIPLIILNALSGRTLPIYGKGDNIRDWLYVEDHARALRCVLERGKVGENYNIGGHNEKTNISVVKAICSILDELSPQKNGKSYAELITFVQDRPGHDRRYAIDARKIKEQLGWTPEESFETGLRKTVVWYLEKADWWREVTINKSAYQGERLGLSKRGN